MWSLSVLMLNILKKGIKNISRWDPSVGIQLYQCNDTGCVSQSFKLCFKDTLCSGKMTKTTKVHVRLKSCCDKVQLQSLVEGWCDLSQGVDG